ncbi:SpoIIE family protein phosphatase [Streptomyces sp. NPDC048623]|uniref:SpoIIE family protein phosphatase n=1 Tax=Streptomyces sp. NPDC048623 TaxID=3155761 RepID=UPI003418E6B9
MPTHDDPRVEGEDEGADLRGLDEAVLDAVFTQSDIGLHVVDPELRVLRVNAVAHGMRGTAEKSIVGLPAVEAYASLGVHLDEEMLREVLATGVPVHDILVRTRPSADPEREHVFSVSVYRLRSRTGHTLGLVATTMDVTVRERAQTRLRLLHRARELIGHTLDVERTARELVDVMVPDFAETAVVALTDAVLKGTEDELSPHAGEVLLRCAAAGSVRGDALSPPTGSVLLPGLFGPELPAFPVVLAPPGPDRPGAVRTGHGRGDDGGTGAGARLSAPLSVRGRLLGLVVFERGPDGEPFTPGDLDLVKSVTTRAAISLDNALRFTREHTVMIALRSWPTRQERRTQRAAEIAQRYQAGGCGAGAWFDALPLPGARVALVVGQVEDPGLSAVAAMSRLRTAVHSLTTLDLDPHELLARLHATVLRLAREQEGAQGARHAEGPTAHCTFAVHDPVSGRFDVARAGRSLFAIVRPDGTLDTAPVAEGPLLGAEGPPFASAGLVLPEGSTVCLASPASGGEDGPTRPALAAALAHPDHGPQRMADAVRQLLAPDRVVLVARTRRLPADELAEWPVPAELLSVGAARRQMRARLREWDLAVDPYTAELVVGELLTNAVRYGASPITLRLIRGETSLICEVDDASPTAPHLRHARSVDEGGRGLYICASLAESWGVRYREDGKTVWAELNAEAAD